MEASQTRSLECSHTAGQHCCAVRTEQPTQPHTCGTSGVEHAKSMHGSDVGGGQPCVRGVLGTPVYVIRSGQCAKGIRLSKIRFSYYKLQAWGLVAVPESASGSRGLHCQAPREAITWVSVSSGVTPVKLRGERATHGIAPYQYV